MQVAPVPAKRAIRFMGGALALCLAPVGVAVAFPTVDPSNPGVFSGGAPFGSELQPQDAQGLKRQEQKLTSQSPTSGSGWTIQPRLTLQQLFTDNVREAQAPRRFDTVTALAPGISILADTARVQLRFDYQPTLLMHAITGNLNAVTQQLNMTGSLAVGVNGGSQTVSIKTEGISMSGVDISLSKG